jgi:hypothetical protein
MDEQVVIYQTSDATVEIEVRTDADTVWLNRQQMAELFGRDVKTIGKHISNALREELAEFSVVAKFATTAADGKAYQVEHYNLDMILSVGYRVKSPEGIRFRQWATGILRDFLINGVAVNQRRLAQVDKVISILARSSDDMVSGIANVLDRFSSGLELLDSYDHHTLTKLFYLIVKDHSFTDGNKRITAALFVYFLDKNGALCDNSGHQHIDNNALAAITLMIALSHPEEKETMCLLVMNMLDTRESL